jgi:predicted transcriptional regulator
VTEFGGGDPVQFAMAIPPDLLRRLAAMAGARRRTPEAQALWLLEHAVASVERREEAAAAAAGERAERDAAAGALSAWLRDLQLKAGMPSSREIAEAAGCSRPTVAKALNGQRVPRLPVLRKIVDFLGGSQEKAGEAWQAAQPEPGGG